MIECMLYSATFINDIDNWSFIFYEYDFLEFGYSISFEWSLSIAVRGYKIFESE